MGPMAWLALAGTAAGLGMALGRSEGLLLRRTSGTLATSAVVDVGVRRLHWLAPVVALTLAIRTATSPRPALALALVPLAVLGPWLAVARVPGLGSADRGLPMAGALSANGVVLAAAFTGSAEILVTGFLGAALLTAVALVARWSAPGLVGDAEVRLAALVGLTTGALGWPAVALPLLWSAAAVAVARGRRPGSRAIVPALLGGAWLAALATL